MEAIIFAAIVLGVLVWLAGLISRSGWEHRVPPTPQFARPKPPSSSLRATLRKDGNASIEEDTWSFLFRKPKRRHWFVGTGCPPTALIEQDFTDLDRQRLHDPALVAESGERRYWWWGEDFYWENGGYTAEDVRAVISRNRRQEQQSLQRARDLVALEEAGHRPGREAIPEEVRRLVFRRDGGRCQHCGSQELLQFDHIIPVAMGGSSEPENLQLLCSTCNREKSDSI